MFLNHFITPIGSAQIELWDLCRLTHNMAQESIGVVVAPMRRGERNILAAGRILKPVQILTQILAQVSVRTIDPHSRPITASVCKCIPIIGF
jgi:hypothetical protein